MQLEEDKLPRWNLKDLYDSLGDESIDKDIKILEDLVSDFCINYKGTIENLHSDGFYFAIVKFEEIEKIITRLYCFAYLNYVTDVTDVNCSKFLQKIKDLIGDISSKLAFFRVEINRISDENFENLLKTENVLKYSAYLRDVRKFKDHMLSEELENFLTKKDISGIGTIVRIFDEHQAHLRFKIDEKELSIAEAIDLLSNQDKETRKNAAIKIGKVFSRNSWLYSIIINAIAKDKMTMDEFRKYKSPISSRNISNLIEDKIVETLIDSVKEKYFSISHKYYKIKAKLLGQDRLNHWDRNAPIPVLDDRKFTFEKAREIVLQAYNKFSPEIGKIADEFFEKKWIDAEPGKNKYSGAFCCSTTSDLHPYVLMNYMGKARDISTLAHELGHGIHMYLSRKNGQLMQDAPLTFSETASIFGEELVFDELLKMCNSKEEKLSMLCQKVDDSINTIIRQVAFCTFEKKIHDQRKICELSVEEISDIWIKVQSESLGDGVILDDDYKYYWSYISHFIHSPFYVYAYAFGNLLVNSLYYLYKSGSFENFQEKYTEMLSFAGTKHHSDLLKPFNLDISKKEFWQFGLKHLEDLVNEIEEISN